MYRNLVCGVEKKVPLIDGSYTTYINFDNAATTPPFKSVLQEILDFSPWYSSIHRGTGFKSMLSSKLYEDSRKTLLDFVKSHDNNTVIYVKNTTEAINKLAFKLCTKVKKCVVLSTDMEHHSNDLPWRDKYIVDYIKINKDGTLSMKDLEKKLIFYNGSVKLVTVSGASNVTGALNPIYEIAELCHKYSTRILVDAAQLIPHAYFNMGYNNSIKHIDFVVFSAHKMYAPFGIGVLVCPKDIFMEGAPDYTGGGTVKLVTHEFVSWEEPPEKEEAGSPNVMGVIALAASIKTYNSIGIKNIYEHEKYLTQYALKELRKIPEVILYDNIPCNKRVSIIPFNIEGIKHNITAEILSKEAGIGVRSGCFCAQPYVQKLLNIPEDEVKEYIENPSLERPGMVRISFGLYNEPWEIDRLIFMIKKIIANRNKYLHLYQTN